MFSADTRRLDEVQAAMLTIHAGQTHDTHGREAVVMEIDVVRERFDVR